MLLGSVKSSVSQLSAEEVIGLCTFLLGISYKNKRTYDDKLTKFHVDDRHDLTVRLADLLGEHFDTDGVFAVRAALFASSFTRKQLLKLICLVEHMV